METIGTKQLRSVLTKRFISSFALPLAPLDSIDLLQRLLSNLSLIPCYYWFPKHYPYRAPAHQPYRQQTLANVAQPNNSIPIIYRLEYPPMSPRSKQRIWPAGMKHPTLAKQSAFEEALCQ